MRRSHEVRQAPGEVSLTRRVVITGLGAVTPLANDVENSWRGILEGRSGAGPITGFDASDYPTRFAAQVQNFNPEAWIPAKDARKLEVFVQYGVVALEQALADAGLADTTGLDRSRVGITVGSGIGGINAIEKNALLVAGSGPRKVSPFFVPGSITNMIGGYVAMTHGFTGPNLALTTACTTSTHAIGLAFRSIAWGDCDVVLAGGAEMATTPVGLAGFSAARALSTRNDDPAAASRPWDRDRDGFVLGDGAGMLVLEDYEHARRRGARMYAEIIGFGMSCDAWHMTAPPEDGAGAAASMRNALRDAGVAPVEVDYINAHGTSTPAGDLAETRAVKSVWAGEAAKPSISSTKSMIGHLLGAAGAVEAIFSVLAIRDQLLPPTINLHHPDVDCDLDYVAGSCAREQRVTTCLSNSFGFGGTNGTLVFRAV